MFTFLDPFRHPRIFALPGLDAAVHLTDSLRTKMSVSVIKAFGQFASKVRHRSRLPPDSVLISVDVGILIIIFTNFAFVGLRH